MIPVLYMAHPISGVSPNANLRKRARTINLAFARAWLAWLLFHVDAAVCVPWLAYVDVLDEDTWRTRGLRDDLIILDRCDMIVACGLTWTAGMLEEKSRAIAGGKPVIDLTGWTSPTEAPSGWLERRLEDFGRWHGFSTRTEP